MSKQNKKLETILSDLASSDMTLAKNAIDKFRKEGNSEALLQFIPILLSNENTEVVEKGKKMLFDIKDENAIDSIFTCIMNPSLIEHQALLCSVLWEAGMECKDRLEDLVQIAIKGDSGVVLEILTVVENIDNSYPYDEILDHKLSITEEMEECDNEMKKQLLYSLSEVLENMTE